MESRSFIPQMTVLFLVLAMMVAGMAVASNGVPNVSLETGITWDTSSVIMREQQRTERERIRAAADVRKAEEAAVTQRFFWVAMGIFGVTGAIAYGYTHRHKPQTAQPPMLMVVYAAQLPQATVELIEGEWRVMDHQQHTYATEWDVRALLTGK